MTTNFVNKWYEKLEKFSRELMTDVIEHCDKTITKVSTEISNFDNKLREHTLQHQYTEITQAVSTNQDNRKRTLQQIKNKKFYALKYNHRTTQMHTQHFTVENTPNVNQSFNKTTPQTSYANALRRKKSFTNNYNTATPLSRTNSNNNMTFGIGQKQKQNENKYCN